MGEDFNKNEKQVYFNQVKGVVDEIITGEVFCGITIKVGHESTRHVNFVMKKSYFDSITNLIQKGNKVAVKYYPTSKKKYNRWYTMLNVLEIKQDS